MLNRELFRYMLLLLAGFYVMGSAGAALACASPETEIVACGKQSPDCTKHQAHDCALACSTTCAAVEPTTSQVPEPRSRDRGYFPNLTVTSLLDFWGPDPPPPRVA